MKKVIFLLIGFIPFFLKAAVLSRGTVVSRASVHVTHDWTVNTVNSKYPIYSTSGVRIVGEAYSYGNKATTEMFDSDIAAGKIPRNWMESPGVPANPSGDYTGIDCSGLVTRSLDFGNLVYYVNAARLQDYTIPVIGQPKAGDVWWKEGHVFLQGPGSRVLEANPLSYPQRGNRVQSWAGNTEDYEARSIFPQFSDESPADGELVDLPEGETTIDIILAIKASGDINTSGGRMFIQKDGEPKEYVGDATLESAGDNTWTFTKEDFDVSEGGNFTVYVIARNDIAGNGYKDEYEWQFTVDPAPPIVRTTDPAKDLRDVTIDKSPITINFSKPMDVVATANAVQTSFSCNKVWVGDEELQLRPDNYLDYCKEYTIIITDAAKSKDGVQLDGNSDGDAGDPYIFTFSTESPAVELTITPAVANIRERNSISPDVITNGSELKKEIDCNMDFDTHNPGGWSVSGLSDPSFSLSPGGTHEDNFTVTNSGASAALRVTCEIPRDCGDIISAEGYYWSEEGHRKDHPDENQSPGKMEYPTPWLIRTQSSPAKTTKIRGVSPGLGLPDIGILLSGWADGYGHILGRYGIETLPIKPDLKILNNPDVDISDAVKLLVIGSAGLKGFNSPTFKQDLEDYVVNGGNLLMGRRFTQILWI